MSDAVDSAATPSLASADNSRTLRRRLLPRFGLRSLFVFALLFCLLFGWVGRNLFRVRQEQAAVEALKQAGAMFSARDEDGAYRSSTPLDGYDSFLRLVGWTERPVLSHIAMRVRDPGDPASIAALVAMAQFPEIESVDLGGPSFGDASFAHLAKLPRLESLMLVDTVGLTGAGVARLGSPVRLRAVLVGYSDLSAEAIEALVALPELETLVLMEIVPVDGDAYAPLAQARRLKKLAVQGEWVRDQDMPMLAKLEGLEELEADGITDAGLNLLAPLSNLTRIKVADPVTKEAAQAFAAAHSRCRVEWRDAQARTHTVQAPAAGRTSAESPNPWDSSHREQK